MFTDTQAMCKTALQDTVRLASYGVQSERRVDELESGIERLRNQQESLRRKLKQQAEKKIQLEVSDFAV